MPSTDPPRIRAQFFYSSALPIDDPLSRVPPPANSSTTTPARVPPRPFSVFDNTALEEAWQLVQNARHTEKEQQGPKSDSQPNPGEDRNDVDSIAGSVVKDEQEYTAKGMGSFGRGVQSDKQAQSTRLSKRRPSTTLAPAGASVMRQHTGDLTLCDDPKHVPFDDGMPVGSDETGNDEFESGISRKRHRSPFRRRSMAGKSRPTDDTTPSKALVQKHTSRPEAPYGSSPTERDTTGTPFLRVASRLRRSRSRSPRTRESGALQNDGSGSASEDERERPLQPRAVFMRSWSDLSKAEHLSSHDPLELADNTHNSKFNAGSEQNKVYITVGISRLHVVEMSDLRVSEQHVTMVLEQAS